MNIWQTLQPRLDWFESSLRSCFEKQTHDTPTELREAMAYSLFAGGKRLRPMLCSLACEAMGGQFEESRHAAIALEMIHTYSLIHDDLPAMDDDDLRRGRPTCHKVFGDAMAILAGDGLQALAFEQIAMHSNSLMIPRMITELARGAGPSGMVGGQVLDLIEDGQIRRNDIASMLEPRSRLEAIHHSKTGALFRSALFLGAYSSGQTNSAVFENLKAYAEDFGLLFQITDDLLDATGTAENTGKNTGKDAARGKLTYPGLIGIEASQKLANDLANRCQSQVNFERGKLLGDLARSMVERTK